MPGSQATYRDSLPPVIRLSNLLVNKLDDIGRRVLERRLNLRPTRDQYQHHSILLDFFFQGHSPAEMDPPILDMGRPRLALHDLLDARLAEAVPPSSQAGLADALEGLVNEDATTEAAFEKALVGDSICGDVSMWARTCSFDCFVEADGVDGADLVADQVLSSVSVPTYR